MNLFWTIFLAIALGLHLPLIIAVLYAARKIVLGAFAILVCAFIVGTLYQYQQNCREASETLSGREASETLSAAHNITQSFEKFCRANGDFSLLNNENVDAVKSGYRYLGHPELADTVNQIVKEGIQRANDKAEAIQRANDKAEAAAQVLWTGALPYRDKHLDLGPHSDWQPLYVKPELVPTPTPPPVVKPIPAPAPMPAPKAEVETLYTSK